jgi:signal transduction histidine kinase
MVLPGADTKVKEYLDVIKSEVDASGRIISDLLDFSRSKTPHTTLLEPKQLIQESLGKCMVPENITVRTELAGTLPHVTVDQLQMVQVFENLITNAVQAMPEGGTLSIKAEEDGEARGVKITVSDTGTGISPENLQKLFQPLFTTKARGVGLGLTVSKRNTEANRGTLAVETEEGRGTVFTVLLPDGEGAAWKTA